MCSLCAAWYADGESLACQYLACFLENGGSLKERDAILGSRWCYTSFLPRNVPAVQSTFVNWGLNPALEMVWGTKRRPEAPAFQQLPKPFDCAAG